MSFVVVDARNVWQVRVVDRAAWNEKKVGSIYQSTNTQPETQRRTASDQELSRNNVATVRLANPARNVLVPPHLGNAGLEHGVLIQVPVPRHPLTMLANLPAFHVLFGWHVVGFLEQREVWKGERARKEKVNERADDEIKFRGFLQQYASESQAAPGYLSERMIGESRSVPNNANKRTKQASEQSEETNEGKTGQDFAREHRPRPRARYKPVPVPLV
jgi:hypothetical protein